MKEMFQSESRGNLAVDEILAAIYIKRVLCLICVHVYSYTCRKNIRKETGYTLRRAWSVSVDLMTAQLLCSCMMLFVSVACRFHML